MSGCGGIKAKGEIECLRVFDTLCDTDRCFVLNYGTVITNRKQLVEEYSQSEDVHVLVGILSADSKGILNLNLHEQSCTCANSGSAQIALVSVPMLSPEYLDSVVLVHNFELYFSNSKFELIHVVRENIQIVKNASSTRINDDKDTSKSMRAQILSLSPIIGASSNHGCFLVHVKPLEIQQKSHDTLSHSKRQNIFVFSGAHATQYRPFLQSGAKYCFRGLKRVQIELPELSDRLESSLWRCWSVDSVCSDLIVAKALVPSLVQPFHRSQNIEVVWQGPVYKLDIEDGRLELDGGKLYALFGPQLSFGGIPLSVAVQMLREGRVVRIYSAVLSSLHSKPSALVAHSGTTLEICDSEHVNIDSKNAFVPSIVNGFAESPWRMYWSRFSAAGLLLARESKPTLESILSKWNPSEKPSSNGKFVMTASRYALKSEPPLMVVVKRMAKDCNVDISVRYANIYAKFIARAIVGRARTSEYFQPGLPFLMTVREAVSIAKRIDGSRHDDQLVISSEDLCPERFPREPFLLGQLQSHNSNGALRLCDSTCGMRLVIRCDLSESETCSMKSVCAPAHGLPMLGICRVRRFSVHIERRSEKNSKYTFIRKMFFSVHTRDIQPYLMESFEENHAYLSEYEYAHFSSFSEFKKDKPVALLVIERISRLSHSFTVTAQLLAYSSSGNCEWKAVESKSNDKLRVEILSLYIDDFPCLTFGSVVCISAQHLRHVLKLLEASRTRCSRTIDQMRPQKKRKVVTSSQTRDSLVFRYSSSAAFSLPFTDWEVVSNADADENGSSVDENVARVSVDSREQAFYVVQDSRLNSNTELNLSSALLDQIGKEKSRIWRQTANSLSSVLQVFSADPFSSSGIDFVSFQCVVERLPKLLAGDSLWEVCIQDTERWFDTALMYFSADFEIAHLFEVGTVLVVTNVERHFRNSPQDKKLHSPEEIRIQFSVRVESGIYTSCARKRVISSPVLQSYNSTAIEFTSLLNLKQCVILRAVRVALDIVSVEELRLVPHVSAAWQATLQVDDGSYSCISITKGRECVGSILGWTDAECSQISLFIAQCGYRQVILKKDELNQILSNDGLTEFYSSSPVRNIVRWISNFIRTRTFRTVLSTVRPFYASPNASTPTLSTLQSDPISLLELHKLRTKLLNNNNSR